MIHTYLYYSFFSSCLHITFNTTISSLTLSFFWWMRIVDENVKARYLRLTFLLAFSFQCQFWKTRRDIHTCPNIHSDPFFTTEQKKTSEKGRTREKWKGYVIGTLNLNCELGCMNVHGFLLKIKYFSLTFPSYFICVQCNGIAF